MGQSETSTEPALSTAYLQGAYDMCRRLLTSPRMNRPQREIIEDEAYRIKATLEERGVEFEGVSRA